MNEEENQAFKILHFYNSEDYGTEELKKYIKIIVNLVEKQQKEIENYQILKDDIEEHNIVYVDTPEFEEKYISKDKIIEKIDLIDKEYAEIIEKNKNDLYLVNINAHRHSAMQSILEELLGE